jgi:hypothetical protein
VLGRAENHLVYFGGGSSSSSADDFFDIGLNRVYEYSQKQKWDSEFFYRKKLSPEVAVQKPTNVKALTPSSMNEKIASLTKDILSENGKIKSGDQLLVYINTHGELMDGKHYIITEKGPVSAEILKSLINAAESKGVKLAVVGQECYGGSLFKYQTPNTCIISSSRADKVGYMADSAWLSLFMSSWAGKTNLEEIYLRGRYEARENELPSQPMISTTEGVLTDEILAPFKKIIEEQTKTYEDFMHPASCRHTTSGLDQIQETIDDLREYITKNLGESSAKELLPSFEQLKMKIEKYRDLYSETEKKINATVCTSTADGPVCDQMRFVAGSSELYKKELKKCLNKNSREDCLGLEEKMKFYKQLQASDEYRSYLQNQKIDADKNPLLYRLAELSGEIAHDERKLYDQLYKRLSQEQKGSNPCRDFKM